jgi:SAM-dependent methyltransferase
MARRLAPSPSSDHRARGGWQEFWDRPHRIYVNARHQQVHYARVADDILGVLPGPEAMVLDHGCGAALHAGRVGARCRHLYLCDAAPSVRRGLERRFGATSTISVLAPEGVASLPDTGLDLVVANSLVQYLTPAELGDLARLWRRKLKPDGLLVVADVLSPDAGLLHDVAALLGVARREGFLLAAVAGLAATFASDYRRLRKRFGLARYAEADLVALLADAGFSARRRHPNFGFNPTRMTFTASPRG